MLNWTLTLFGELDPDFVGTPVHVASGIHGEEELEVPVSTTTAQLTSSDNTPSRPTPNKSKSTTSTVLSSTSLSTTTDNTITTRTTTITTTSTTISTTSSIITSTSSTKTSTEESTSLETGENEQMKSAEEGIESGGSGDGYLTVLYSVVGSVAIFGIASVLYIYKKNGWKSPSEAIINNERRPDGYEFDVLQPLTEFDEEDEESDEEDSRRNNNNH